jgi:hypothetical protein
MFEQVMLGRMLVSGFTCGTEVKVGTDLALVARADNRSHVTAITRDVMMDILSHRFSVTEKRMKKWMNTLCFTGFTEIKVRTLLTVKALAFNGRYLTVITGESNMNCWSSGSSSSSSSCSSRRRGTYW